jgi:hypothetical protein
MKQSRFARKTVDCFASLAMTHYSITNATRPIAFRSVRRRIALA